MTCPSTPPATGLPDAGEGLCCMGAAARGPEHCTCWEPVYDVEQAPPEVDELGDVQPAMCGDCAYRRGSPERSDERSEDLAAIVASGQVFWCHQGMRRPIAWRHPSGVEVAADPADYQPVIVGRRPYQADGTPALVCAGWATRRLAHMQRGIPA